MRPLNNIFLKISLILLFVISGKVAAQTAPATTNMPEINTVQHNSFKAVAVKNITEAVNALTEKQNGLSESKIDKRIRKKKDPILIPYSLNKKSFSYC